MLRLRKPRKVNYGMNKWEGLQMFKEVFAIYKRVSVNRLNDYVFSKLSS